LLLEGWSRDRDVEAWLVPIDPKPAAFLRPGVKVKYLRTLITEATYLPRVVREIARADIVHAFSASYWSFILAPLPAMLVAKALGRPFILNYHSGEAPDHLARSRVARAALARATARVVPSPFLSQVFDQFGLGTVVIPNAIDLTRFAFR